MSRGLGGAGGRTAGAGGRPSAGAAARLASFGGPALVTVLAFAGFDVDAWVVLAVDLDDGLGFACDFVPDLGRAFMVVTGSVYPIIGEIVDDRERRARGIVGRCGLRA